MDFLQGGCSFAIHRTRCLGTLRSRNLCNRLKIASMTMKMMLMGFHGAASICHVDDMVGLVCSPIVSICINNTFQFLSIHYTMDHGISWNENL